MMKEQLSALMDSELSEAEATRLIQSMKTDHSLHEAWDTYHLVGDALRKSPQFKPNFNQQMAQRIALELPERFLHEIGFAEANVR